MIPQQKKNSPAARAAQAARDQGMPARLQAIGEAGRTHVALDLLLQELLSRLQDLLTADTVDLLLLADNTGDLVVYAAFGGDQRARTGQGLPASPVFLDRLIAAQGPVVVHSQEAPELPPLPGAGNLASFVAAPLLVEGRLTGVLCTGSLQPRFFALEDTILVQLAADRCALAVAHGELLEQIRHGHDEMQSLSIQLINAQEAERRHIARELHDDVGQALTALQINCRRARDRCRKPADKALMEENLGLLDLAIQQIRMLTQALRPSMLDEMGLVVALEAHLDVQAGRGGLTAHFAADPLQSRLSPSAEMICIRVALEALTNTVRHSKAQNVAVSLRQQNGGIELIVRDDGTGFDVAAARARAAQGGSLGLLLMEERVRLVGGRLEINSLPQGESEPGGTEVRAWFPPVVEQSTK